MIGYRDGTLNRNPHSCIYSNSAPFQSGSKYTTLWFYAVEVFLALFSLRRTHRRSVFHLTVIRNTFPASETSFKMLSVAFPKEKGSHPAVRTRPLESARWLTGRRASCFTSYNLLFSALNARISPERPWGCRRLWVRLLLSPSSFSRFVLLSLL